MDDMVLVSIDDHIIEPPDLFEHHLPSKYRDRAPRYVPGGGSSGAGAWFFQGQETGYAGLGSVAGWPRDEWGMDPVGFEEMRPGIYDIDQRVRDMDANGQLTALCFPTFAGFNAMSFADATMDPALTSAVISAYNDWHIHQVARRHPGRFIPLAILPTYDPAGMVAEIHRVAAEGVTAVSLPETPYGVGLPAYGEGEYWEPVFRALCDTDMTACMHIGGAFRLLQRPPTAGVDDLVLLVSQLAAVATTDLMLSGTFRRFPDLRIAMSEGGIGWVGFFLDRMDRFQTNQTWADLKVGTGAMTPTEVWRRNFLACFITDPTALLTRHRIGIENIAWECDYPHSDCTWPESPELLWQELTAASCTDDEIDAITWRNAARFFRFDPFQALPRERATVGALRASAVDIDVTRVPRAEFRRRWEAENAGVGAESS